MSALKISQPTQFSRVLGVGGERGNLTVTNEDIAGPIDSSDEWIRQRTGIVTRRRASEGQSLLDMCEAAAIRALDAAGLAAAEIDAVIVATVTHLVLTPSLAATLADRIGTHQAAAWDISAACAGYPYAIGQADALIRAGAAKHVLVVGAERMSDVIDPTDRTISFILGDGAGASVLGPSDEPAIGPTVWGSDGAQDHVIGQTHSFDDMRTGKNTSWPTLRQEGPTVFKWAAFEMARVAQEAIDAAGLAPADIDVFIPHQANMRIIDQLMKSLSLREDVVVGRDIAETGNTSAASIPLATERLLREGQAHGGQIALQIGFGAGLAFAAQVIVLPHHKNTH